MTRKPYSTDLTHLQWATIEHLLPAPKPGGRPRKYCNRDLVAAVFYINRTGCAWRLLPHDFPPWESVYAYFRRWRGGEGIRALRQEVTEVGEGMGGLGLLAGGSPRLDQG
jgi:transposase